MRPQNLQSILSDDACIVILKRRFLNISPIYIYVKRYNSCLSPSIGQKLKGFTIWKFHYKTNFVQILALLSQWFLRRRYFKTNTLSLLFCDYFLSENSLPLINFEISFIMMFFTKFYLIRPCCSKEVIKIESLQTCRLPDRQIERQCNGKQMIRKAQQ